MEVENTDKTIGARFREVLAVRGQTIRDFASASGVPYRTLQDYLGDKAKPGAEQLARIALAGIDIHYLLTGSFSPFTATLEKSAVAAWGKSALHEKPEALRAILADYSFTQLIQKDIFTVIDGIIKEKILSGERDIKMEELHYLYTEGLRIYVYTAISMGSLLADLRKLKYPPGKIIELVRDAAAARLQAIADRFVAGATLDTSGTHSL